MTTLVGMITSIVGTAPVGWEFVPYLLACISFFAGLWLVWKVISIPLSFLRR